MGYSYSRAYIVNTKAGWMVVFGNGYESTNGKAVLYIVRLSNGNLLRKIDTQYGDATENCNGLSTPALIDIDQDGLVDYVYAGDLLGNMWKFDLTDTDYNEWDIAFKDSSTAPQPLFRALNKNGHAQPITSKPDVILGCDKGKKGYQVIFGTGRLLGKADVANGSTQSIYGIWDWADEWKANGGSAAERATIDKYLGSFETNSAGTRSLSNLSSLAYLSTKAQAASLVEQTEVHSENDTVRVLTQHGINWYSRNENSSISQYHVGWYFDLPDTRERIVQDLRVRDNTALVLTTVPVTNPCENASRSYFMEIDSCTGGRTKSTNLDVNNDQTIDEDDLVLIDDPTSPGGRSWAPASGKVFDEAVFLPVILTVDPNVLERKFFSTAAGEISTVDEAAEKLGIFYWKEVE